MSKRTSTFWEKMSEKNEVKVDFKFTFDLNGGVIN